MIGLFEHIVIKADQNKTILNQQQLDFFIKASKAELFKKTNTTQDFLYHRVLRNIFDQPLLFLQFTNHYLIITLENYETNEIANSSFDKELFDKNNVVYIPGFSLHYQVDGDYFGLVSKQKLNEKIVEVIKNQKHIYISVTKLNTEKNKAKKAEYFNYKFRTKRGTANPGDIADKAGSVSNLFYFNIGISNSWWFKAKDSYSKLGYIEYQGNSKKPGLCEYIAMSLMLEYAETFIASGIFSNEEIARYFDMKKNYSNNLSNGVAEHKYYKYKHKDKDKDIDDGTSKYNSLPYQLFELNGRYQHVKYASYFTSTLEKFLKGKEIKKYITTDYSANFMHSSNPETFLFKNNMPVMVSFANIATGHNIVLYGYDPDTEKYLVNFGWPGNSNLLISKWDIWSFWSMGYWWAFKIDDDYIKNHPPKQKLLSANGKFYSHPEIFEEELVIDKNGILTIDNDIY
ncbi:putative cysteine peptidase [Mesomycoplasma ovipneumoniae]|uniref:putative cysteine peptidase n=1 Tax=Mesomycoplasma ovipneumoniae TaxID=29562 RepID=UPI00311AC357